MLFITHLAFAFLVGLIAISTLHPSHEILFILLVLSAAGLPDLDHPNSTFGKKVRIFSWFFSHRGFMHSVLILPLIALLFTWLFKSTQFTVPLLIGYTSHLIGDMVSYEGIKPFTPLSSMRWRLGWFRVGSAAEYVVLGFIICASVFFLLR